MFWTCFALVLAVGQAELLATNVRGAVDMLHSEGPSFGTRISAIPVKTSDYIVSFATADHDVFYVTMTGILKHVDISQPERTHVLPRGPCTNAQLLKGYLSAEHGNAFVCCEDRIHQWSLLHRQWSPIAPSFNCSTNRYRILNDTLYYFSQDSTKILEFREGSTSVPIAVLGNSTVHDITIIKSTIYATVSDTEGTLSIAVLKDGNPSPMSFFSPKGTIHSTLGLITTDSQVLYLAVYTRLSYYIWERTMIRIPLATDGTRPCKQEVVWKSVRLLHYGETPLPAFATSFIDVDGAVQ